MNKKNFLTPVSQSKQSKKYFNFARRHSDFSRNVGVETPTYNVLRFSPKRTASLDRNTPIFQETLGWKPQPTVFEIIFRDARFHSNVLSRGLKDLIFVPKGQYVVPFAEACCVQNRARHASVNPTKAAISPSLPCRGAPKNDKNMTKTFQSMTKNFQNPLRSIAKG